MLHLKKKDQKFRLLFKKFEFLKKVNKFLKRVLLNNNIHSHLKEKLTFLLEKKKKDEQASKVKLVRRCVINNRSRGVIRPFGISRIYLRELLQFGLVPGFSKAVW